MSLNLAKFTDRELAEVCVKHHIIPANELRNYTRESVVDQIARWCEIKKQKKQGIKGRRMSAPSLSNASTKIISTQQSNQKNPSLSRRSHSTPMIIHKQIDQRICT